MCCSMMCYMTELRYCSAWVVVLCGVGVVGDAVGIVMFVGAVLVTYVGVVMLVSACAREVLRHHILCTFSPTVFSFFP